MKLSQIETFLDLPSNHVNKDGGKREKRQKQGLCPIMQHAHFSSYQSPVPSSLAQIIFPISCSTLECKKGCESSFWIIFAVFVKGAKMYTIHRNLQIATGKYLVAHPTVLTSFRPLYAAETRIRLELTFLLVFLYLTFMYTITWHSSLYYHNVNLK